MSRKLSKNTKMEPSIYTAIPLLDNDIEQPLLLNTENDSENSSSTSFFNCWGRRLLTSWQFLNGFWLGFAIQTISLGSTAIIAIYYGASEVDFEASWMEKTYRLFFFVFFLLSQSWWLLFPAICIAIDSGLTGSQGQSLLQNYFMRSSPSERDLLSKPSQREVFLGGVRFHVGIVFGCFVVWSMIDLYFGASLAVFAVLTASMLTCLGLCYGMVIIYDRYINNEEDS